jgi:hypothetical protein
MNAKSGQHIHARTLARIQARLHTNLKPELVKAANNVVKCSFMRFIQVRTYEGELVRQSVFYGAFDERVNVVLCN